MKRILCIVCCLLPLPVLAGNWAQGTSGGCFVHYSARGAYDDFYYCGNQDRGCAGYKDSSSGDKGYFYKYGDKAILTFQNILYYCCDNKWVAAGDNYKNSFTYEVSTTINVSGGTCTYIKTIDACGKVIEDTPCTEATTCEKGYSKRNNVCVKPCLDGFAYESETSNNCVTCQTTNWSGKNIKGVCVKCHKDTQFYDKMTMACVDKSDLTTYSLEQMTDCFMCKDNIKFKQCLDNKNVEKGCPKNYVPTAS